MSNYNQFIEQIKHSKDVEGVLKKNPSLKKDKDFFNRLFREKKLNDDSITFFDKSIGQDKDIVLKLVGTWPLHLSYEHISDKLKADKDVAFEAFKGNSGNIEFFPEEIKEDEKFMRNLVASSYPTTPVLKFLSEKYRNNKEFVMALLKKEYNSFEFVSDNLKEDQEVVWMAMFGNGTWYGPIASFPRAALKIKADKDFVKKVLEEVKGFRDKASIIAVIKDEHKMAVAKLKESKGDKSGKLAQVKLNIKQYKKSLESSDSWDNKKIKKEFEDFLKNELSDFSDDAKVLMLALEAEFADRFLYGKDKCMVLNIVDKNLLEKQDFCSQAMLKTNGKVYPFLPDAVKNNTDFFLNNFSENIKSENVDSKIKKNRELALMLVEKYPHHYNVKDMIDDELYGDKKFMKECLKHNGSLLDYAKDDIKKDKKLVEIALSNFRNALSYADKSLLNDEELMVKSLSLDGHSFLTDLSLEQRDNKNLLLKLAKSIKDSTSAYRDIMRIASLELKKDKELALICVSNNGWSIENVDESIKYDKDILSAAFDSGCHVYKVLDHKKLKSLYSEKELKKIMHNYYEYLG